MVVYILVPATQEAEAGGSLEARRSRLHRAMIVPQHSSLGNRGRPRSKEGRKEGREEERKGGREGGEGGRKEGKEKKSKSSEKEVLFNETRSLKKFLTFLIIEFLSWAYLGFHFVNYLCISFAHVSNEELIFFLLVFIYQGCNPLPIIAPYSLSELKRRIWNWRSDISEVSLAYLCVFN